MGGCEVDPDYAPLHPGYGCCGDLPRCESVKKGAKTMFSSVIQLVLATCVAAMPGMCPHNAAAADAQVERGKYLVIVGGCNDCHTPAA
jgi:CxxC motif-containing protein (DUF1111 family)